MDVWKEPQLARMRAGGNKIFTEYMRQRGIPSSTPIKEKYSSRAAEDYRARLSALAEGREPPLESGALTKMAGSTPSSGPSSASRARRLGSTSGRAALRTSAPVDSADDWASWDDEPTQHASPLPSRGANTLGVLSATRMASRTPTPPTTDSAISSPVPHSKSSDWLQELEGLAISEDAVLQSPAAGHSAQLPRGHRHTLSDSAERDGTHRHHTQAHAQQQRRRPGFEPLTTTCASHTRTRSPQPTQLTPAELDAQRRLDAIYGAAPPSSPSPSADHPQQSRSAALAALSDSWSTATAPAPSASSLSASGPRSLTNAPQQDEEDWWTSLSRSASQTIAASTTKLGEVSSTVLNSSSNYLRESGISEKVSETSNQGWGLLSGLVDSARHLIAGDADDEHNAQPSAAAPSYAGSTSSASTSYSSYASTASSPAPSSSLSSSGRGAGVGSASLTSSALADPSAWSSGDSSLSSPAGVKSTGGWAEWDEDWG